MAKAAENDVWCRLLAALNQSAMIECARASASASALAYKYTKQSDICSNHDTDTDTDTDACQNIIPTNN